MPNPRLRYRLYLILALIAVPLGLGVVLARVPSDARLAGRLLFVAIAMGVGGGLGGALINQLDKSHRELRERHRFSEALIDNMASITVVLDAACNVVRFNRAAEHTSGRSEAQVIGQAYWSLMIAEEDLAEVQAVFARLTAGETPIQHETHWVTASGGKRLIRWTRTVVTDERGKVRYFIANGIDVTEQKSDEAELRLAASVFRNTSEAVVVTDAQARILSVNPAFTELTGYTAPEVLGRNPRQIKSGRHDRKFYQDMWTSLLGTGEWRGEIWNRRKDGETFLAWQTISGVRDDTGAIFRFVSVFSDITELHVKDEQLRHQAYHDALTGLPNRLLLQDRLAQGLEAAKRHGTAVGVLFIDLDRFKVVNDSLGHDVGDMLLVEVARRIHSSLRRSDTVARLGGDEFVVVLHDVSSSSEVAEVVEKLIAQIVKPMVLQDHPVQVGASVGIALFPQDGSDVTSLMKGADAAMYQAKTAGRSGFRFFDASMNHQAVERLRLEMDLRQALERGELRLYYQPKVDIRTRRMQGAEALIRWHSPTRGIVMPGQFIPVAEETGLIVTIGDWVISEACRQLAQWRDAGKPLVPVAVNVSARQFIDPRLAEKIAAAMDSHGLSAGRLEIELTESAVMTDPELAVGQLRRLQDLGVTVHVDDFGTGYSSLSYLKRLPLDSIKVDRTFVQGLDRDPDNAAIVRAIIGLGKAIGMPVVAEGVENGDEEARLFEEGCATAQGYHYTEPLPPEAFEVWLDSGTACS